MPVPVSRRLEVLEQAARTAQAEPLTVRIVGFDGEEGDALEIILPMRHRGPVRPAKRGVPQR